MQSDGRNSLAAVKTLQDFSVSRLLGRTGGQTECWSPVSATGALSFGYISCEGRVRYEVQINRLCLALFSRGELLERRREHSHPRRRPRNDGRPSEPLA